MDMIDIIAKKRDGGTLSDQEIKFFISEYTEDRIPDYQAAALLMAIYLRGLSDEETFVLTAAMRDSGDKIDLSRISGTKVDKHSTGGVGDKITLVVAPIAAACGVNVSKMSGRGLGFTGGTVDKLESIPGFNTKLEEDAFFEQVDEIGLAVISQTATVARADKKLYALRDVTGTIANHSLIASSIMSKKLASGADAILLDVKCGNGAFLKDEEDAGALAEMMIRIGKSQGKRMGAVISDMNEPLGFAVGNSLEVIEAIETLKGNGPRDLTELSLVLAGGMIYFAEQAETYEAAREMAKAALADGRALDKLGQMIEHQGGECAVLDDYSLFPKGELTYEVKADADGYISSYETEEVGIASQHAGAGRFTKEDDIDFGAGIIIAKKIGDKVSAGDVVMTIYANDESKLQVAAERAARSFAISQDASEAPRLIKQVIGL